MIFGFKDSLRQAVEAASGGLATVMYTPKGQPLFMRRITPFRLEDLAPDGSLGTGWHPAFPDGREFWVSVYRVRVNDGEPISVPGVGPTGQLADAWLALPMPPGMRLLSILEYSALALMGTHLLGDVLRGNDARGQNSNYPWETGVREDGRPPGATSGNGVVLTGSGPVTWRHDHTPWGVELLGNRDLFVTGLRFVNGKFQLRLDGAPIDPFNSPDSSWLAWDEQGDLVSADTATPKLGYTPSGKIGTTPVTSDFSYSFGNITPDTGITIPPLMRALGLVPSIYSSGMVNLYHSVAAVLMGSVGGRADFGPAAPGTLRGRGPTVPHSALVVYSE